MNEDVCTFNEYFVRLDNNVMSMKGNLKAVKLKHTVLVYSIIEWPDKVHL